jgi:RNA polymerase sigma-70 factor (ECF subfamily)
MIDNLSDTQDADPTRNAWVRAALERYQQPLIRYAARLTGNAETARDVVQDTFVKLCAADQAKIGDYLPQWLYRVCRNRALDVRKKEGRMSSLEQAHVVSFNGNGRATENHAEGNETHALVLEAVGTLPEKEQEVFRLKFEHGMTYREISAIVDMPLSSVSYTLAKALKSIRKKLRGKVDLAPNR